MTRCRQICLHRLNMSVTDFCGLNLARISRGLLFYIERITVARQRHYAAALCRLLASIFNKYRWPVAIRVHMR